jgi:sec-independent protein translocase protein TatC
VGVFRRLTFGVRRLGPSDRVSVVEHLEELRRRIFIAIIALVIAFIGMYVVRGPLIELLEAPVPSEVDRLVTLGPTEPLITILKVCFWAAVIVALPVWLYQLYAYVIPAVGHQSRRKALMVVAAVSALFLVGVAFGYFIVLPIALEFLLSFGGDAFETELRAGEYFAFATTLLLATGLVFEVPVAMVALARLGVADAPFFRRQWRFAIVAIAVIAAILPGGDPFTMILLMIPMIILYQVGIWLAAAFGGRPLISRFTEGTEDPPTATES